MLKQIAYLLLLFLICSCTELHKTTEQTVPATTAETQLSSLEQEAKNRYYFLEKEIGWENITAETFPALYQGIFDPLPATPMGSARTGCESCDYNPTSCTNFALYLNLLESACRQSENSENPTNFCQLFRDCSRCCIDNCGDCGVDEEPDDCSGGCPSGQECVAGICQPLLTECERAKIALAEYRAFTNSDWAEACNLSIPLNIFGLFECEAFLQRNRLQYQVYRCHCEEIGIPDISSCIT